MKAGEFPDGARTLRAKIDMAAPNIWLRDPVLYRIRHADASSHRRQVVHLSDVRFRALPERLHRRHHALDLHAGVRSASAALRLDPGQRSICREPLPHQYEFARLNLTYTVMSKRKLMQLVNEKLVTGWDDPRMPTISGMRRRGVTPTALAQLRLQHRHHEISEHDRRRRARTRHSRRIQPHRDRAAWPCCGRSRL